MDHQGAMCGVRCFDGANVDSMNIHRQALFVDSMNIFLRSQGKPNESMRVHTRGASKVGRNQEEGTQ